MRPLWKGSISLVGEYPVALYPATNPGTNQFHLLRDSDRSPIHYKGSLSGRKEVDWEHIVKDSNTKKAIMSY